MLTKHEAWVRGATVRLAPAQTQDIGIIGSVCLPKVSVFREFVHYQVFKQNSNFIVLVEGLPGTGKSVSSLGVLERWSQEVTKHFSVRYNVTHSIKKFMARVADLQVRFEKGEDIRGTALVLDDAGVSADSRRWFEDIHKLLNDTAEVFRYLGLVVFLTVPNRNRMDKRLRDLAHGRFKIIKKKEGEYTLAKFYLHEHHWKTNEPIFTLLRARNAGWNFKITSIKIRPPSLLLRREYEVWMREFKGGLIIKNNALLNQNITPIEQRRPLTERQKQVYFLYRGGQGISAIGAQLGIGEGGVSTHLRSIRARGWDI